MGDCFNCISAGQAIVAVAIILAVVLLKMVADHYTDG
jgi:hypothetical protein